MSTEKRPQRIVVVGAGPVGTLAALYAANRGDHVDVYELRGGTTGSVGSRSCFPSTEPLSDLR